MGDTDGEDVPSHGSIFDGGLISGEHSGHYINVHEGQGPRIAAAGRVFESSSCYTTLTFVRQPLQTSGFSKPQTPTSTRKNGQNCSPSLTIIH